MLKLLLLTLARVFADEVVCHHPVKLWIHQDGTGSFKDDFKVSAEYIPKLLTALESEFSTDGFDFGLSVFADRDSGSKCFRELVGFGGDLEPKIADAAKQMSKITANGGGWAAEDTFSSIPYIVKHQFLKDPLPGEVRLLLIITDDVAKYHNMPYDAKDWGFNIEFGERPVTTPMTIQWEGSKLQTGFEDQVQCGKEWQFLSKEQICEPLKTNVITPLIMNTMRSSACGTDIQPFYKHLFADCGYDESANEVLFTRFETASTAQDIIIKIVGDAKCEAPTAPPDPDHTTSGTGTTSDTTEEGGGGKKKPIIHIAAAAAGAVLLIGAGAAYLHKNRRSHMDVEEEIADQAVDEEADREARAEIDEGQFAG